jgi:hypothetical protein
MFVWGDADRANKTTLDDGGLSGKARLGEYFKRCKLLAGTGARQGTEDFNPTKGGHIERAPARRPVDAAKAAMKKTIL